MLLKGETLTLAHIRFRHDKCPLRNLSMISGEPFSPEYLHIALQEKTLVPMLIDLPLVPRIALERFYSSFSNVFKEIFSRRAKRRLLLYALVHDVGLITFRDLAMKKGLFTQLPFLFVGPESEDYVLLLDSSYARFIDDYEDALSEEGDVRVRAISELREPEDLKQVFVRKIFELTPEDEKLVATALALGYFDVPKKITLEELSERLNIPKSTLNVKLRSSIGRILERLVEMYRRYYELLGIGGEI